MSGAGIEDVPQDFGGARDLHEKAQEHVEDAERTENHASSRFLLAYQASLDLMNAILRSAGQRITSGPGGHIRRIEACKQLMPEHAELFERIDDARHRRNRITYDGAAPREEIVDELTSDVEALARRTAEYVDLAERAYHAELDDDAQGTH